MPSLFSRIRGKDGKSKKGAGLADLTNQLPSKPRWEDAYARTTVEPEEIVELVRRCTEELKSRALDHPFLLLPFRPTSDPSAVRIFIRHFFDASHNLRGEALAQELRMTEPMVISGVIKWCWSRIQGGVVGWDAYELFKVGESDSNMARNAFTTFIPLSVENDARSKIIFDYFDLMSAVAAHGKSNGFGGRKLSRMASWWAFEYKDTGNGFDGGYKFWLGAADATSHLFFAYLRSLGPEPVVGGISMLPRSLQKLLQETEYPPQSPSLMQSSTYRVNMIVDTVSPTPFALLRRANHFQYRDSDRALHEFSEYEDPVQALTEECRRVLKAISLANQSQVSSSKVSTGLRDASWSRFEDIGFAGSLDEDDVEDDAPKPQQQIRGLRMTPASGGQAGGRPTTPSWADFLSSGFVDDSPNSPTSLLPPDKILPPIDANVRQRSSQSHRPRLESNQQLEPGELASINKFDLDDAFWWVWMSSLAPEETPERKSAFGRCAVIETVIRSGRWLIMEETVKGAAAEPDANAYIAEKKGFFSWTRRNKGVSRSKSTGKKGLDKNDRLKPSATVGAGLSKTSIGPDQQAKIQAAAQQLQRKEAQEQYKPLPERRGRTDAEVMKEKTNSVLTLQPVIMKEASPAMKWANKYDKDAIREAYLGNVNAGRGLGQATMQTNGHAENGEATNGNHLPVVPEKSPSVTSPATPQPTTSMGQRRPLQEVEHPVEPEKSPDPEHTIHPVERLGPTGRNSPMPPTGRLSPLPPTGRDSPLPQPPQENSFEAVRETMSPEPGFSYDHKPKKLHKEEKKASGGLRKLFSRRNRASKLPENAPNDLNAMLAQQPAAASQQRLQVIPSETAVHQSQEQDIVTPTEQPDDLELTHSHAAPAVPEPAYEASVDDNLSRVDTADAHEAHHEFSRFDQGPLTDQPAFVPGDEESEDDATPPPIARHTTSHAPQSVSSDVEESSAPSPSVPMQDRWAQIRQNAAVRARQSEEQSRGGYSKTTDDDDNTSGEETIESRVARIKARVAELTGNMEGTTGPGSRTPPRR